MRIENREVVFTNTVVTHRPNEAIEFGYLDLSFRLEFTAGPYSPADVGFEVTGPKSLTLRARGFDSQFGQTWVAEVGTLTDKKLFLAAFVQMVGAGADAARLVSLTLSTEAS